MAAVKAPPLVAGALASALESGREGFNAKIAAARRSVAGFDPERFARQFGEVAQPVVDAVASVAPDRVPPVALALFDVSLAIAARGSLGPTAGPLAAEAWRTVLPAVAPLVAEAPDRVARALTNAINTLVLVPATRPWEWTARMAAAGAACTSVETWLRAGLVCAWACGVAHFRRPALEALTELSDDVARRVLALPANASFDPRSLAASLEADPWLPPAHALAPPADAELEVVATVGGFVGLGGSFIVPPDVALSDGRIVVFDGSGAWTLFADACGSTLVRIDSKNLDTDVKGPAGAGVAAGGQVTFRGQRRTFPVLAEVSSIAATPTTLAVAVPRSHDVFVIGLAGRAG